MGERKKERRKEEEYSIRVDMRGIGDKKLFVGFIKKSLILCFVSFFLRKKRGDSNKEKERREKVKKTFPIRGLYSICCSSKTKSCLKKKQKKPVNHQPPFLFLSPSPQTHKQLSFQLSSRWPHQLYWHPGKERKRKEKKGEISCCFPSSWEKKRKRKEKKRKRKGKEKEKKRKRKGKPPS